MNARRRSPLSWDDLRVFLALARAPNLAAGARAAGVDKSTVSRRLGALERALAARLFARTREGLKLTPAGMRLSAHAEAMERAVSVARHELDDDDDDGGGGGAVRGLVRLATTEGLASWIVERGLLDVLREHRAITLEIVAGNAPVDLTRGGADLALRLRKPEEAAVKVRKLAALPFAAFASSSYVQARGLPRKLAQLPGHDLLVPGGDLARLPEARILEATPRAQVVLRSSSMPSIAAACARGHGVTILTQPWGRRLADIVELFVVDEVAPRPLWLAFTAEQAERRAVRVVADKLEALAAAA
jgi:DNA-binding transcriptional LysR family regulator